MKPLRVCRWRGFVHSTTSGETRVYEVSLAAGPWDEEAPPRTVAAPPPPPKPKGPSQKEIRVETRQMVIGLLRLKPGWYSAYDVARVLGLKVGTARGFLRGGLKRGELEQRQRKLAEYRYAGGATQVQPGCA